MAGLTLSDLLDAACNRTEGYVNTQLRTAANELEADRVSNMESVENSISTALSVAKHDGYPEQTLDLLRAARDMAAGADSVQNYRLPHDIVPESHHYQ